MTLALIAVIVFLIVWGCQVGDRKAKKKEYQDKTRTNLVLEKEIYQKVEAEVSSRLNSEDIPVGELYPRLLLLFDEYGVAYCPFSFQWRGCSTREEFIAQRTEECRQDELFVAERGFEVKPKSSGRCTLYPDVSTPLEDGENPTTMDRIRHSYIITKGYTFYGNKHSVRASTLEATYRYLLSEITRKRMDELGFAFTKTGVRESEWQEQAKQTEEMERLKAQYPYLFR